MDDARGILLAFEGRDRSPGLAIADLLAVAFQDVPVMRR
jgi:hypothetical protein